MQDDEEGQKLLPQPVQVRLTEQGLKTAAGEKNEEETESQPSIEEIHF